MIKEIHVSPERGSDRPGTRTASSGLARTVAGLLLVLATGACSALGWGESEPEIPNLAGEYTGTISLRGEQYFGDLEIAQDEDGSLQMSFRFAELGLSANGEGRATPSGFTAEVSRASDCPGTASLEGVRAPIDRSLTGSLVVEDCDGSTTGTFRFAPQD